MNGYTIQSDSSNGCGGNGSSGLISAIPADKANFPRFNLASSTGLLTYNFKGKTGTNFSECLGMICGENIAVNLVEKVLSYPKEINDINYCVSHGKITGGTKLLCGTDPQHASEKHAHWHCEEADSHGDCRHVLECNQAQKDYGCKWNSEKSNFELAKDGKTCAEKINETSCKPNWTKRLVCLRFAPWPSAYRACTRQTSGCSTDYVDPRWDE